MYDLKYIYKKNKSSIEESIMVNSKSQRKLRIIGYDNAIIASKESGGPGIFVGGKHIRESDFNNAVCERRGLINSDEEVLYEEEVVFIGTMDSIWGHCITDNLKHLWFILLDNQKLRNLRYVYVMKNTDEELPKNFMKILALLNIHESKLVKIRSTARFSRVYLPEQCFFCSPGGALNQSGVRYFTSEYLYLMERIKSKVTANTQYKKIYFTRTGMNQRMREFGEKCIENEFRKLGYTIFSPEKMDIIDQISILSGCECFASTQGSVSLNAVFCNDNARIIIIDKQNYLSPYQHAINQTKNFYIQIIDANKSVLNAHDEPWKGPFFVFRSVEFCEWAKINKYLFPMGEFVMYLVFGGVRVFLRKLRRFYKG